MATWVRAALIIVPRGGMSVSDASLEEAVEQASGAMERCRARVATNPSCWIDVRAVFENAVIALQTASAAGHHRGTTLLAAGPIGIARALFGPLLSASAGEAPTPETRAYLVSEVERLLRLSIATVDNSQARYYMGLLRADVEGRWQDAVEHYEAAVWWAVEHNAEDKAGSAALRELRNLSAEGKIVSETVRRFEEADGQ